MATAEQKARAEIYRDAAAEHVPVAHELYDRRRFVLASYVAGLAVECILRAYRLMIDPEFDSRHDLEKLYALARFSDVLPAGKTEQIVAALGVVTQLWSNEFRFFSEAALRQRWARQKRFEKVKGDFVKEHVRRLVNAASVIVTTGAARWDRSFDD